MRPALIMLICTGIWFSAGMSIAEELPDYEINRLFSALTHPDAPGAPDSIDGVNKQRQKNLATLFKEIFPDDGDIVELLPVHEEGVLMREKQTVNNVRVVLEGKHADQVIVIGAHLDQVWGQPGESASSQGAIDDWSGVALLVKLYEHLKKHVDKHGQFHHTFVFIGFAYEESGLWGSETYVQQLVGDQQLGHVKAMVNFECLGVSDLYTWDNGSTDWLEELAEGVAKDLDLSLTRRMLTGVGADSVPFLLKNRPAITIDSLSNGDFGKIHTSQDKVSAIKPEEYRSAFRFAKTYLKELDATLAITPSLADESAALPSMFASLTDDNPIRHLSWEPSPGSIVPSSFMDHGERPLSLELQRSVEARFKKEIEVANDMWLTAARNGDAEAIAKLYTEDATIFPAGEKPRSGREAIKDYYVGLFEKVGGSLDTSFESNSLHFADNLAYETGIYAGDPPIHSYVVWVPVRSDGQLSARFQFDAWH